MTYRTLWVVRHVMPDGRLAHTMVDADDDVIVIELRAGHIHPALARSMATFSKAFAETGLFELDPDQEGRGPELVAWFERADRRLTDGRPMRVKFEGRAERPWSFEILVRDDLADEELVREMNTEVMPTACGLLVPARLAALSVEDLPNAPPPRGVGASLPHPRDGRAPVTVPAQTHCRFPRSYSATHSLIG